MGRINGFDACKQALKALVADARNDLAAKQGNAAAYAAAVTHWEGALFQFANDCRPGEGEEEAVEELRTQAIQIGEEIRQAQMHEIVGRIEARSLEIEGIGKEFGAQALQNADTAKRGRLLPIKNAIDSLTGAVNQVKQLRDSLDVADRDEQKILEEVESLIERFEAVKASIDAI